MELRAGNDWVLCVGGCGVVLQEAASIVEAVEDPEVRGGAGSLLLCTSL